MKYEKERLRSFNYLWPHSNVLPYLLSKAGFFFYEEPDVVKCAFCDGVLKDWKDRDLPLKEHREEFPFCPFHFADTTTSTENIPYDPPDSYIQKRYCYRWHYFLKVGNSYYRYSESQKKYKSISECIRKGTLYTIPTHCEFFISECEDDSEVEEIRAHYFTAKSGTNELKLIETKDFPRIESFRTAEYPNFSYPCCYELENYFKVL